MPDFASFDGTTIHYEIEGDGFPVVLLHGIIANYELNWKLPGISQALVDAGHQVIGVDARGHGSSGRPHGAAAYADDAMAKDAAALFDHLGLDEADVVGYSMGGAVAMRFALRDDRVRRLVVGGFAGRVPEEGTDGFANAFEGSADDVDPAWKPFRQFADGTGMDIEVLRGIIASKMFEADYDATKITAPTLVIGGADDPLAAPAELAAALPDGRAKVTSGDHFTAVIEPQFAKEIVAFLS